MHTRRNAACRGYGNNWVSKLAAVLLCAAAAGCSDGDSGGSGGKTPDTSGSSGSGASAMSGAGIGAGGTNMFGNAPTQMGTAGEMRVPVMPSGGASGSGSCAEGMADTSPVTPTVWLVVDGSTSMNSGFDSAGNRWQVLRSTLMDPGGIVDSLQAVVRFGMVIYAGNNDGDECVRLVTAEPQLNNFDALDAIYPLQPLGAGTPTDQALEHVVTSLPVLNEDKLDENRDPIYVVLATDGAPNMLCGGFSGGGGPGGNVGQNGDPAVMQRVIDVVTSGTTMGMQMFIISLAGDDMGLQAHLMDVANATSSKTPPFVPANKADLIANFQSIVGGATCQVARNGTVAAGPECTGTVLLNGEALECNSDNGWRMPDDHTVQLTGDACDKLLTMQSLVTARFPCGIFTVK